jgi:hypothetical protein
MYRESRLILIMCSGEENCEYVMKKIPKDLIKLKVCDKKKNV